MRYSILLVVSLAILTAPFEERGLAHTAPPQDIRHGHAALSIRENPDDLTLAELRLPHYRS